MTVRKNGLFGVWLSDERIIRRYASIIVQAIDLTTVSRDVLGVVVAVAAVSDQVEGSVAALSGGLTWEFPRAMISIESSWARPLEPAPRDWCRHCQGSLKATIPEPAASPLTSELRTPAQW